MAREVTPPPQVARSRDLPTIITSTIAVIALVAGVIITIYSDHAKEAMTCFAIAALAVVAVAMRLFQSRSSVSTGDLAGEDNTTEN